MTKKEKRSVQKITCAIFLGFCGEMYARADVKHGIHFKRPNMYIVHIVHS